VTGEAEPPRRVPCVGAVCVDAGGRLLVVRRANPPSAGAWSLPGGRVEGGESPEQAVAREVLEETGLVVRVGALVGTVERPAPDGATYVIADHACAVVGGVLRAGDDAADVAWVAPGDEPGGGWAPGVLEALAGWGVWPAASSAV